MGQRSNLLEGISKSFISLSRLYNQTFTDKMKQNAFDTILGHDLKQEQLRTAINQYPIEISICTWNVNETLPDKL